MYTVIARGRTASAVRSRCGPQPRVARCVWFRWARVRAGRRCVEMWLARVGRVLGQSGSPGVRWSSAAAGNVRSTAASGSLVYESKRAVDEYLHFHYAPNEHTIPYKFGPADALQFPARMAGIAAKYSRPDRRGVAYDVGCSVGRGTFEMTKTFDKVVGIDFSHSFINAALELKAKGAVDFEATEQAVLRSKLVAKVPEGAVPERAEFRQGDACNLGDIGTVDCITAVNLLCRLPEPRAFLQKAIDCVREGGILVLVSPYSWLEEYTPPERWLGGRLDSEGKPIESHRVVGDMLAPFFNLEARSDEAFLLREHARKFQWGVSDCTVWRRM